MIKIIIASDSFKGSMSAKQACLAIKKGFDKVYGKNYEAVMLPMADGGEGSVAILQETCDAQSILLECVDSIGRTIEVSYAYDEKQKTAYLESAQCCGLTLVPECNRDIMKHTSYGLGSMILHAKNQGAKEIIVGLGGTGTNDGGFGMLCALAKVPLYECCTLSETRQLAQENLSKAKAVLEHITFTIACDVTNPYIGSNGATKIFAHQKGASNLEIEMLEYELGLFHEYLYANQNITLKEMIHSGAAGGIAGACAVMGGTLISGVDLILERTNFEQHIKDATCILSGEGSIDSQSADGKTLSGICKLAQAYEVPVVGMAGRIGKDTDKLYEMGLLSMFSITSEAMPLRQALMAGEMLLAQTAENIARLLKWIV